MVARHFRKDFDKIVNRHGWSYKGGRGWRTRVIYETNLRTAYQAGRFKQLTDPDLLKRRPFWRYKHSDSVLHPRPEHLSWDGLVLPHDDPFWQSHYPPNGWGCQCKVFAESERSLERKKLKPGKAPPIEFEEKTVGVRGPSPRTVKVPKGIDPGWAHAPGRSWVASQTPGALDSNRLLPPSGNTVSRAGARVRPRVAPATRLLPDDLPEDQYIDSFLAEFGAASGDRFKVFEDVAGTPLMISDELFRDGKGELKVKKRGRQRYILLLADTIKTPDEIWEGWGKFGNKEVLRRRYIARWKVDGEETDTLAVYETGPQGWVGVTAFNVDDKKNLEKQARQGKRVYKK